jgi:hemin uptake protein HemP
MPHPQSRQTPHPSPRAQAAEDPAAPAAACAPLPPAAPVPCHEATDLTAGGAVARIRLNGQHYALRITRQGKLILTK